MANNVAVTAGTGTTFKTTDNAGVHTGHQNIDLMIPGTAATNLGKAEDAAHTTGDVGVMALGVRVDADTPLATTSGDYIPLTLDELGFLKVRGRIALEVAPTMGTQTSGGYTINFFVGGKLTLTNAVPVATGSGRMECRVLSKSTQTANYDVIIFNADPTATTISNNAAIQVNVADLTKVAGVLHCEDITSFGTGSLHQSSNVINVKATSGTTLYAAVVTRAAITQNSTSDMILLVSVWPD